MEVGGSGSDVVFNSVNVTGTDVVNGQGIEVNGGSNYRVKNNIFANNGGGNGVNIKSDISSFDWDYNGYYSSGVYFGKYLKKHFRKEVEKLETLNIDTSKWRDY